jgi:exonuclease V gamma subunit
MTSYRVVIREIEGTEVLTSYTRWLESVQLREAKSQEVYVEFNARFERIWLEAKKRLPEYMAKKQSNAALRSQYSLGFYGWAKKASVSRRAVAGRLITFFERRTRIIRNLSDPRSPADFSNTLTKILDVSIRGFPREKSSKLSATLC